MQNKRAHPRYGVRIEGKLMSPDMVFCVDVVIRDLSEAGALVNVVPPAGTVPERVYLWQAQTRTLFECKVQWRKNDYRSASISPRNAAGSACATCLLPQLPPTSGNSALWRPACR